MLKTILTGFLLLIMLISLNFTFKFGKLEFKKEENKDVNPVLPEGQ